MKSLKNLSLILVLLVASCGPRPTPPIKTLVDPTPELAAGTKMATEVIDVAAQGKAATPSDLHPTLDPYWDAIVRLGKELASGFKRMAVTAAAAKQQFEEYQKWSDQRFTEQDAMYAASIKDADKKTGKERESKEAAIEQRDKEHAKRVESETLYHDSWLGGRAWRMIYWICGIGVTLIIIDTLLFVFTGAGTLNPLTIVINLIGRVFKKKEA